MDREIACGLFALVLAGAYYGAADALPSSLLADAVGADGVPKALAIALALLGALQLARSRFMRPSAGGGIEDGIDRHGRAAGLLIITCAYVALLPYIGYPVALAALVFAVAAYAGLAPSMRLAFVSGSAALVFWIMFVKLLGVPMPVGRWLRLFG